MLSTCYLPRTIGQDFLRVLMLRQSVSYTITLLFVAADVGDTGAEFDRVFLQELRDLKVFVNDKDIVDEHKR